MLVLEPLDAALARGATVYAEVLGYGASCDSHHMTAAHPQADGAIRAMSSAISQSGITTSDIDYISAHGTGTPTNDRIESLAVRTLFGEMAPTIPMSSIKSMLGHTMGAASAIEALTCAMAVYTGWIPPTINHEEPDPDCGLDIVPNHARKTTPKVAVNNAYAFGGNNASLCVKRYEDWHAPEGACGVAEERAFRRVSLSSQVRRSDDAARCGDRDWRCCVGRHRK